MKPLQIARDALKVVWNHKSLWLFGFFLAGGGGVSGQYSKPFKSAHAAAPQALPGWLLPAVAGAVVIAAALLLFTFVSEGALIDSARKAKAGEAARVRDGMRAGLRSFWRVLGVKLSVAGVMVLSAAVLALPFFHAVTHALPKWAVAAMVVP